MLAGFSLSSFLQMLEQERKSCTLIVNSEGREGCFFFDDGMLIDAAVEDLVGERAAYTILGWEHPAFKMAGPEDRMQRIQLPLAHILLDSAKMKDEEGVGEDGTGEAGGRPEPGAPAAAAKGDPVIRKLVEMFRSIAGINHYFLLNRQGQVITQSARTLKLGDFITYAIVSGIQMRKALQAKGPNRIQLVLASGETLLIVPGAGMIIGLLLEQATDANEVMDQVRPALAG